MHTKFYIFKKLINLFEKNKLVFSVVASELNQKDVGFLQHTKVRTMTISLIKVLLADDN
jgi:hypothetical protein